MEELYDAYYEVIYPPNFFKGWSDEEFLEWVSDVSSEKVLLNLYEVLTDYDLNHYADLLIDVMHLKKTKN